MKLLPIQLMLKDPIEIVPNVYLRVPTVREVAHTPEFSIFSRVFMTGTRELFSTFREVDELEEAFPTIWDMLFDESGEGDIFLGNLLGTNVSGYEIVVRGLAYWTGLDVEGFQKLSTNKIIHRNPDWIIDEKMFMEFRQAIIDMIGYEPNNDYIAPKPMNDAKYNIWKALLDGRLKKAAKGGGRGIADKMLILSISMESYIPINEILDMSIYLFNKTYMALQEKEGYEKQWQLKVSPKFDSEKIQMRDWRDKLKL